MGWLREAVTSWGFWVMLGGWLIGAGLAGGLLRDALQRRHERAMARNAAAQAQRDAEWATGRTAAQELTHGLERMRTQIHYLDPREMPGARNRLTDTTQPEQRIAAVAARDAFESLVLTRAGLLPEALGSTCHEMNVLVSDYMRAMRQQGIDRWDGQKLQRTQSDVLNYLAHVQNSLRRYIRTAEVVPFRQRPALHRDDPESWTPR
jgi:hypothetical protein